MSRLVERIPKSIMMKNNPAKYTKESAYLAE